MSKYRKLTLEEFDDNNMEWPPFNEGQEAFMRSRAHFLLGHGGFGSGKTHVLVKKVVALLTDSEYFGDCSGNRGLIGRFKEKDFSLTTLPEFMKSLPKEWIKRHWKNDGIIELVNESLLFTTHLESIEHLQSFNLSFASVDQIEQISEKVFDCLSLERVRNKVMKRYKRDLNGFLIPVQPQFIVNVLTGRQECISTDPEELAAVVPFQSVFGVCNPKPGFLQRRFLLNEKYKVSLDPNLRKKYNPEYEAIELPVVDNVANLADRYIERQRENKTAREFKRDVGGSWKSFEGQVHDNFTDDLIGTKNLTPHPSWKIYAGIDHGGSSAPDPGNLYNTKAVIFKAVERRENQWFKIHTFDEIYLGGKTIEECVGEIDSKLQHWAVMQKFHYPDHPFPDNYYRLPVCCWRCDPSMRKKAAESSDETIMEVYMRHASMRGLNMSLEIGNNEVATGIEKINWIHKRKLERISPCCVHYIEEHQNYMYDVGEKPAEKQADHLVTANRYICSGMNFWWDTLPSFKQIESREQRNIKAAKNSMKQATDNIYGTRYAGAAV